MKNYLGWHQPNAWWADKIQKERKINLKLFKFGAMVYFLGKTQARINFMILPKVTWQSFKGQINNTCWDVVWSLGWENLLEEEMATHSRVLAWESHRQRTLVGYSLWGRKEWDTMTLPCSFGLGTSLDTFLSRSAFSLVC